MNQADECPNVTNHTPCPDGYAARAEWAQKKGRRHEQLKCPVCGLWVMWIRRQPNDLDYGGDPESWEVEPSKEKP